MADYYPLLQRAISASTDKTPEARRNVYERARAALVGQLRAIDPPVSEAHITRERLSLDEAIRRMEGEFQASPQKARPPHEAQPIVLPEKVEPPAPLPRENQTAPPFDQPATETQATESAQRERPRIETVTDHVSRELHLRPFILGGALFLVIGLIAIAAWLLRDRPANLKLPAPAETAENDAKFAGRIGGAGPEAESVARPRSQDIPVAQRAILYEENATDPQNPKAVAGRALWRLDAANGGQGQALETIVRANVDIPESGISMVLTLRRNLDASLPASHTVELAFTTGQDPNRTVRDVGLLQLKAEENMRGTPVSGLPVPVRDNFFLIGLSSFSGDIERNTELLTKRNWIDIPIRLGSGQRAIVSFEKGNIGEQAVTEAFRQWQ